MSIVLRMHYFLSLKMLDSTIRLQNEFKNLQKNLSYGCFAQPNKKNSHQWDCQIYENGSFYKIRLDFPKNYPNSPPRVTFASKVFNPNVYATGEVCLDLLSDRWLPSLTVADIFTALKQLLEYPNPNSPANAQAAKLFTNSRAEYSKKVESVNKANMKYEIVGYMNK